jgi:hypothetical protein
MVMAFPPFVGCPTGVFVFEQSARHPWMDVRVGPAWVRQGGTTPDPRAHGAPFLLARRSRGTQNVHCRMSHLLPHYPGREYMLIGLWSGLACALHPVLRRLVCLAYAARPLATTSSYVLRHPMPAQHTGSQWSWRCHPDRWRRDRHMADLSIHTLLRGRAHDTASGAKKHMPCGGSWLISNGRTAVVSLCPSSIAAYRLGHVRLNTLVLAQGGERGKGGTGQQRIQRIEQRVATLLTKNAPIYRLTTFDKSATILLEGGVPQLESPPVRGRGLKQRSVNEKRRKASRPP